MTFKKGEKIPGQGKRGPSKVSQDVKNMIEAALAKAGGVQYLYQQSAENPTAFMALVGKTLTKDIKAELTLKGLADVLEGLRSARGSNT